MPQRIRLLVDNVGYLLGYRGRAREYLAHPARPLLGNRRVQDRCLSAIADQIVSYEPDLVHLIEVDSGSMRAKGLNQVAELADACARRGMRFSERWDCEYEPTSFVSRLPLLRHWGNGLLWRTDVEVQTRYLGQGNKRVVHVVTFEGGLTVFAVHLSLPYGVRHAQLEEIFERLDPSDPFVICGDLNLLHGTGELDPYLDGTGIELVAPGPSYPSYDPSKCLDVFLCSPSVQVDSARVFDDNGSDHLAVGLTCSW